MLNVVAIMGRLTRDPELKTTQSGVNVCRFSIACDRSFVRQGEERKADFIDIVAWRQQADFVCKYFGKGSLIAVDGRLQTESYQAKDGTNRTRIEVVANNVSFAGAKAAGKPATASYEQQTAKVMCGKQMPPRALRRRLRKRPGILRAAWMILPSSRTLTTCPSEQGLRYLA